MPGVELRLGSLGSLEARRAYLEELKAHLRAHEGELSEDVRERIDVNPLRAFDSDDEGTRAVMASAPTIVERLEGEDAEHFAEVRALLDAAGVAYEVDPTLVRGLDYYTRTIFSFVCDALGAQSEIGGGGRYDGLIEQLGGPPTPAVGWAAGIERILLALDEEERAAGRDAFVAIADDGQRRAGDGAGRRAAPRRARGRARPRRAQPQGPAEARRPDRRPPRPDPRGRRHGAAARHGAPASSAPVDTGDLVDEMTGGEAR